MNPQRVDLRSARAELYVADRHTPVFVDVPRIRFLMIDGRGPPPGAEFLESIGALYMAAYTIKRRALAAMSTPDYILPPLEGLWWHEPEASPAERESWRWTLMLAQPENVTEAMLAGVVDRARTTATVSAIERVRLEVFEEGPSLQVLHIGPLSDELPALELLYEFARTHGHRLHGRHHEIYLTDPRKAAPERFRTILRHPIQ